MRSYVRRAIVLAGCLGATAIAGGCQAKKATEYVAGISTQVTVPRDLKIIRVEVNVGGFATFCRAYKVYDGRVQLPRSLGAYPLSDSALQSGPITYTILGITEDVNGPVEQSDNPILSACVPTRVGSNNTRILRRSRQPYVPDEILFLPMPLKYSCFDKQCDGDDTTCKAGKCVPALLKNPDQVLPRFTPDLLDGTGGTCFHATECMLAAAPAISVDPNTCTFAVPNTPSAPKPGFGQPNPFQGPSSGEGVNVEVLYDGGLVKEILDIDPEEGFTIPDPAKPQQFRLSDGLCEMMRGFQFKVDASGSVQKDALGAPVPELSKDGQLIPLTHRITGVRTSGSCQAKQLLQPLCANDQLKAMGVDPNGEIPKPPPPTACSTVELKPPQAALMVVVDDTVTHKRLFDVLALPFDPNSADEDSAVQPALRAALSDPAFARTDIGLLYTGTGAGACNTAAPPTLLPKLAFQARDSIIDNLKSRQNSLVQGVPSVEGGLLRAYQVLGQSTYDNYFRRAILYIGNGHFNDDTCAPVGQPPQTKPSDLAAARFADKAKRIDTYVMQLTKDPPKSGDADVLSQAGGTGISSYKTVEAQAKFQEVVNSLATCVYDIPTSEAPKDTDLVAYADPITGVQTKVPFNGKCSTDGVLGEGWGFAPDTPQLVLAKSKRIHLCTASCDPYHKILDQMSKFAALYQQPPVPVPVFAYRAACLTCKTAEGEIINNKAPGANGLCPTN